MQFFHDKRLLLPLLTGFAIILCGLGAFSTGNLLIGVLFGLGTALVVLVMVLGIVTVQLPLIAVHEIGAGWLVGFRFMAVKIGYLHWYRDGDRIRLMHVGKPYDMQGGYAMMKPVTAKRVIGRNIVHFLGGP